MTPLLEQAVTAIQKLPENQQTEIAELILEILKQKQTSTKEKIPYFLSPAKQGSGYKNTAQNHDAVLAEAILNS
jgi:hypothetical protein